MTHTWPIRVYYEDTDLAGIVYHGNYLNYIERARTELVRSWGIDQTRLKAERDIVFAVRRIEADYLAPALFDDQLEVRTEVTARSAARLELLQQVWRGEQLLFSANVTVVVLTGSGRPTRLPADIRA